MHSVIVPDGAKYLERVMVVRNPYERLVSMIYYYSNEENKKIYFIKDRENFIPYLKRVREIVKSINLSEEYDTRIGEKEHLKAEIAEISEEKFIFLLFKTLGESADAFQPKYFVHIENPTEDMENLNIKLDVPFPHENKTPNKSSLVKHILNTQEKIDFANNYFSCADDAIKFGYKPIYSLEDMKNDNL